MTDTPIRLLLLEDKPIDVQLIRMMLSGARLDSTDRTYKIHATDTLAQGLTNLAEERYDALLVDLNLPDSQGIETILAVTQAAPDTPVIVVSAMIDHDLAIQAVQAGAQDYLVKDQINAYLIQRSIHYAMERKQMESKLKRAEAQHRSLLEHTPDLLARFDRDCRHVYVNPAAAQVGNLSLDQYIGKTIAETGVPEEEAKKWEARIQTAFETGQIVEVEDIYETPAGLSYFNSRFVPEHGPDGRIETVLSLARDITERKRVEAQNETQLRRLAALHAIDSAITGNNDLEEILHVVLTQTTTLLDVDAACVRLLDPDTQTLSCVASRGFRTHLAKDVTIAPDPDLVGQAAMTQGLVHIDDPAQIDSTHFSAFWAEEGFTAYASRPLLTRGRTIGALELFQRTPRQQDEVWISFFESLTEQAAIAVEHATLLADMQTMMHQAQSQAQLTQQIIDNAPAMLVLDRTDHVLLANPLVQTYLPILTQPNDDSLMNALGDHPLTNFLRSNADEPQDELTWGVPPHIYQVKAKPLIIKQRVEGRMVVMQDVTEERERQRYKQRQEQLAVVGQMAAGIAHDFNNILGTITLYADLMQKDAQITAKQRKYLTTIHDQSHHASHLVRQILDFSRRTPLEQSPINLGPLIKELVKMLERTLPENVRIDLAYDRNDYEILGDPSQLQRMLMNLAINARDAMQPLGGNLRFALSTLTLSPDQTPPLPDMPPGDWLQVAVSDTGSGIKPQDLDHLFEPFFTTKPPGLGTGLGLAQVYGIVKQHNGAIDVQSHLGQGSTFIVYLPLYSVASYQTYISPNVDTNLMGTETILLVEDNEDIRMAIADSCQAFGYQVLCASDGVEALRHLNAPPQPISLVISDLIMPGMGGAELVQAMHRRHPDVKILIMSGYPLNTDDETLGKASILDWIQKPFSIADLAGQIREMLDTPHTALQKGQTLP